MESKMLLISNPARRRKHRAAKKRHARRARNPMPAGLAKFLHSRRRRHGKRRSSSRVRSLRAISRRRTRNPSMRGLFGALMPMTVEALSGAAGSLALDYLWGQINPRLPATLQSAPGKVGVGDAVKVVATVAIGQLTNRMTRGFGQRAARGALTVQFERIIRSQLPDAIRMQLAYAQPAGVINGQYWTGPNRVRQGAGLRALQPRGGPTPLLSGLGALQRPGAPSQLLSAVSAKAGLGF